MARMTIDELAQRGGTTTRNVRAYQDRGLLPPPEIVGRTGYYGEGHLARLRLIQRLLDQRFSLASIGTLLEAWESGQSLGHVLGFEEVITRSFAPDPPVHASYDELVDRFGPDIDEWLQPALELGLVVRAEGDPGGSDGDGSAGSRDGGSAGDHYVVLSPKLIEAGAALVAHGIPLRAVMREAVRLRKDADRIASRFNTMFSRYVWKPFIEAGRPADQLPEVSAFLSMARPLPADSTAAMVALAMTAQQDEALAGLLGGRGRDGDGDGDGDGAGDSGTAPDDGDDR